MALILRTAFMTLSLVQCINVIPWHSRGVSTYFANFLPKTARKWKNLDWEGFSHCCATVKTIEIEWNKYDHEIAENWQTFSTFTFWLWSGRRVDQSAWIKMWFWIILLSKNNDLPLPWPSPFKVDQEKDEDLYHIFLSPAPPPTFWIHCFWISVQ